MVEEKINRKHDVSQRVFPISGCVPVVSCCWLIFTTCYPQACFKVVSTNCNRSAKNMLEKVCGIFGLVLVTCSDRRIITAPVDFRGCFNGRRAHVTHRVIRLRHRRVHRKVIISDLSSFPASHDALLWHLGDVIVWCEASVR